MTEHVHDTAEGTLAHRHRDRRAGRLYRESAPQSLGGAHGDSAHDAIAELLLHLEREVDILQLQRLIDLRNRLARKLDVDDGADDLGDLSLSGGAHDACFLKPRRRRPRSPRSPW